MKTICDSHSMDVPRVCRGSEHGVLPDDRSLGRRWAVGRRAVAGLTVVLAVAGCPSNGENATDSSGAGTDRTKVVEGPAGTVRPTAPAAVSGAGAPIELPSYSEHKIEAGRGSAGIWTGAFGVVRGSGDTGLGFLDAQQACHKNGGKSLCPETLWLRACEADAALGRLETWTATSAGEGVFSVRGGEGGCSAKSSAAVDERKATRGAVCCDRAVGIKSDNTNASFLGATSKWLLEYEKAINDRDRGTLRRLYSNEVRFLGKKLSKSGIEKEFASARTLTVRPLSSRGAMTPTTAAKPTGRWRRSRAVGRRTRS
jgi:hypothetical protein